MKKIRRSVCLVLAICLLSTLTHAHESRPGYLQLTLTDTESVELLLKVPALGNMRLGLYPNLPENCVAESPSTSYIVDNAFTERRIVARQRKRRSLISCVPGMSLQSKKPVSQTDEKNTPLGLPGSGNMLAVYVDTRT